MISTLWIRIRRAIERLITGQSLEGRLALLTGMSVAASVLLVGTTAYLITRVSLLDQLDRSMLATASNIASLVANGPESADQVNADVTSQNRYVGVLAADGRLRQKISPSVTIAPSVDEIAVARLQTGSSARLAVTQDDQPYRLVTVPFLGADGSRMAMMYGQPMASLNSTLSSLWVVVLVTGLAGVLVTTAAASLVARAALTPVRRLSQAVKTVTQTDQLNPIRIYGRDDLGELTQSFNTMLKSLASSREQQRQLIADAGHELRTPLTSMRTNVELLVADDKAGILPEGARAEILDDVSAQLGEFSALIGDLVALTRDDHLQREPEPFDLAEVVEASLARARRRGPGVTFDVSLEPTMVMGDATMMERAVTNLLDNAVKFSPADGLISVVLQRGALTIIDSGEGIAEEDLPHIFDRFFRSDRSRNTPGTGLGLSIVQHAVDAHGGTVRAGNDPVRGARFTMRIPTIEPHSGSDEDPDPSL